MADKRQFQVAAIFQQLLKLVVPVKSELQAAEALRLLLEQVPSIKHLTVHQEQQLGASYKSG
jgi:hypothetical protein